jgi:dolichol-phosphate mannosyltransferase
MQNKIDLSLVVPVYKEERNIKPFLERTELVFSKMKINYEIIFTLDPSPDNTELVIKNEIKRNPKIKLIIFSRRFGQPSATIAGILECKGDTCVVIDVDLQDPPEIIESLYDELENGYEVVYAKRKSRKGETLIKKIISYTAYIVINKLSDIEIPRNTGDFRIMTRRFVEELRKLNETHGFLRGLVAFIGFKQSFVEYDRDIRYEGKGNYNRFTGSFKIGFNGIIGFSSKPIFLMSISGFFIAFISFILGFWYLIQKIMGFDLSPGLPTTVLLISFFTGIQLLGLGLIGEYVGRIYDEVKKRPQYIIDKVFEDKKTDEKL